MDAGWVQVIEGLVVPVSIAIVGYFVDRHIKRVRADRTRLKVATSRWAPNTLRLDIRYQPQSTHASVLATVTVLSPGVRLHRGRPVLNPAPMANGGYTKFEFDGVCVDGKGPVTLKPYGADDMLMGVMFLAADGTQGWILRHADIEIAIHEHNGPILLTRKMTVSPVGEGPETVFVEPASLNPPVLR
jgi:hypothetical protein